MVLKLKPAITLDVSEHITKAVREVSKTGLGVIVTKNGKYYGLIDDRELRKHASDPAKMKCETVAVRAPCLSPQDPLLKICNTFFSGRFKAIPVIEGAEILGVVTRSDVIGLILEEKLLEGKMVGDVMSSPVVTVEPEATIASARALMKRNNVRRLVVAKGNALKGIISTFDLASVLGWPKESPGMMTDMANLELQPVSSYMRADIETIGESEPLAEAAKTMVEKEISSLVVSDGAVPVGVITARDIFETAISYEKDENIFISGLEDDDKQYYDDIKEECRKALDVLNKSFPVRSLSVHIKRYETKGRKRKYSIRGRLVTDRLITVSTFEWGLSSAIKWLFKELNRVMEKGKIRGMDKRRRSG